MKHQKHTVQFDKQYLDGILTGLTIAGECCTFPDYEHAQRHAAFLQRVEMDNDFIRDAATGQKYYVSNVTLFPTEGARQ